MPSGERGRSQRRDQQVPPNQLVGVTALVGAVATLVAAIAALLTAAATLMGNR